MSRYQVQLASIAEKELQESFDWYEERSEGLGDRFVEAIDNAIASISLSPESYQNRKGKYREFVVDKFPFIVVYEIVDESQVNILHVFHTSRHPKLKYKSK